MVFEVELVRTVTQRTTVNVEAMSIEDARDAGNCLGWYFAGDVPPEDWRYDGVAEGDTEAGDVQERLPARSPGTTGWTGRRFPRRSTGNTRPRRKRR